MVPYGPSSLVIPYRRRWQKDLSRKEKGSNNRHKARLNVAKRYEKISHQRKDFLHKTSAKMIRDNQVIVMEDLRVKNMMQNHKLAKPFPKYLGVCFVRCLNTSVHGMAENWILRRRTMQAVSYVHVVIIRMQR